MSCRAVFYLTIVVIATFVAKSHERALVGDEETTLLTENEIRSPVTERVNDSATSLMDGEAEITNENEEFSNSSATQRMHISSEKENFESVTENQLTDQSGVKGIEDIIPTNSGEVNTQEIEIISRDSRENAKMSKDIPKNPSNISEYGVNNIVELKTDNRNTHEESQTHVDESLTKESNTKKSARVGIEEVAEVNTIQFPVDKASQEDLEIQPRISGTTETPYMQKKYVEEKEFSSLPTKSNTFTKEDIEVENFKKVAELSNSIKYSETVGLTVERKSFEMGDPEAPVTIDLPTYNKGTDEELNVRVPAESPSLINNYEPKAHRKDLLSLEGENALENATNLSVLQETEEDKNEELRKETADISITPKAENGINYKQNTLPAQKFEKDPSRPTILSTTTKSNQPTQQPITQVKQEQAPGAWYSNIVALFPTYVLNPLNYFGNTPTPWNYTNLLNYSSLNFGNLLRSQSPINNTHTPTTPPNTNRNTAPNTTQLHLIPYFKIFKVVPYNASALIAAPLNSPNTINATLQQQATNLNGDQEAVSIRLKTQNVQQIWPYYRYQGNQMHTPAVTYTEVQPTQTYNYPSYSTQSSNEQQAPTNFVVQQVPTFGQGALSHGNPFIKIEELQSLKNSNKTTISVGNTPKKTSSSSLMVEMVLPSPILKFMKNIYNLFATSTN